MEETAKKQKATIWRAILAAIAGIIVTMIVEEIGDFLKRVLVNAIGGTETVHSLIEWILSIVSLIAIFKSGTFVVRRISKDTPTEKLGCGLVILFYVLIFGYIAYAIFMA